MNLFIRKHISRIRLWEEFLQKVFFFRTVHCIIGYLRKKDMDFYGVTGSDLDGIVSQLRLTRGVEVAIFIYELETQSFKVSLRSNGRVDVSKVAVFFGGGGHTRAAGCDLQGSMYDVINNITAEIEKQLTEEENA